MELAQYLEKTNTRKSAFARVIEVHPAQVGRWIAGESMPSMELVATIEQATRGKVRIQDLYKTYTNAAKQEREVA